jgi:uncharacterized protein YciI
VIGRLVVLALTALPAVAVAQAPAIPPEIQAHIPRDVRPYFLAFLVTPAEPRPMSRELFIRHQGYIRSQFEAGVYRLVGPVTDGGRIRGMVILSAASAEEAQRIVAGDPSVQEHVLDVEVHPAMFPSLDTLRVSYPPRP